MTDALLNEHYSPLFQEVQLKRVFPDSKTFVDCLPLYELPVIEKKFLQDRTKPGFNLTQFVLDNFDPPVPHSALYQSDPSKSIEENIEALWDVLTRQPDEQSCKGSLIPLPYPYIVPGGRFGEIYYWDSYFTMLGLKEAGRVSMIENMVKNFAYLIDRFGFIPNGNRTYFSGRSQPPFFSLMIELLASLKGDEVFMAYLPQLEKEYSFWMKEPAVPEKATGRAVRVSGNETGNRYFDSYNSARPESYVQDIELAQQSGQDHPELFRHLRAGAESGWDYSCRWFEEENDFGSIHTADILPVDLNCLLYNLEKTLAAACRLAGDAAKELFYQQKAKERAMLIQKYCWNEASGFYYDYDLKNKQQKKCMTLAAAFPLYMGIAGTTQADKTAAILKEKFLKKGGLVTTLVTTGQQWDAPNGWAPLQWIAVCGLENYKHSSLAKETAQRWIRLNKTVFERSGKMMEKYNVENTGLEAGGGEYDGQDGFGWTNGVFLALTKKYGSVS